MWISGVTPSELKSFVLAWVWEGILGIMKPCCPEGSSPSAERVKAGVGNQSLARKLEHGLRRNSVRIPYPLP